MKEKKQFNPKVLGFTVVLAIIWQAYLIIRFTAGTALSPLYMLHVVLAIILDIKLIQLLVLLHKAKKRNTLSKASRKWNRMWELWVAGKMESPYAELMTLYAEVCNGGHGQYFENVRNNGDLQKEMAELERILPPAFRDNLKKAYEADCLFETNHGDDSTTEIMVRCDTMFFQNEETINQILEACAAQIKL